MVSNKVAMMASNGPTPMDVGEVDYETFDGDDVGVVSANTQCHGCGGWGHLRRDCPTVQNMKGNKGKGKGKGPSLDIGKGGLQPWS